MRAAPRKLNRRQFAALAAGGALAAPRLAFGARPRLVVVGGGAAGATVARLVGAAGSVSVTLVEPSRRYYSCFGSNLYLGGLRDFETLGHGYERLALNHGVNVVQDWAAGVDRDRRRVALGSGGALDYDRLVLAPGIDIRFDAIEGYGVEAVAAMPHAYKSGTQVQLLRQQLEAMRAGGTFVMTVPALPYKCPPGPYERACMAAHLISRSNPNAKIVILDAKEDFPKSALFREAWDRHYPGMVEWLGPKEHGGLVSVDPQTLQIRTAAAAFQADVANVIAPQKAGTIAAMAGVTDKGWCPVIAATLQSRADPNVHVLGDAAVATAMPKSAFAANSQAHVAADAILSALTGSPAAEPFFGNTCWSLVAPEDAVFVGGTYKASSALFSPTGSFISEVGEDDGTRRRNAEDGEAWYGTLTQDMFG